MLGVNGNRGSKGSRGDGLVEFALVLPILIMLLMGILDLGRAFYAYSAIANAAREGARQGIITPEDTATIVNVVQEWAIGLASDELAVTPTYDSEAHTIQVTVNYSFYPVTPLVSQLFGGQEYVTLTTNSVMTVE